MRTVLAHACAFHALHGIFVVVSIQSGHGRRPGCVGSIGELYLFICLQQRCKPGIIESVPSRSSVHTRHRQGMLWPLLDSMSMCACLCRGRFFCHWFVIRMDVLFYRADAMSMTEGTAPPPIYWDSVPRNGESTEYGDPTLGKGRLAI